MSGAAVLAESIGAAPLPVIQLSESLLKSLHIPTQHTCFLRPVFASHVSRQSSALFITSWLPRVLLVTESGLLLLIDPSDGRVTHEASLLLSGSPPAAENERLVHIVMQQGQQNRDRPTTTLWMKIAVGTTLFAAILRFKGVFQGTPTELLRVILHFVPQRHVSVQQYVLPGPLNNIISSGLRSVSVRNYDEEDDTSRGMSSSPRAAKRRYMKWFVVEEWKRHKTLHAELEKQQKEKNENLAPQEEEQEVDFPQETAEEDMVPNNDFAAVEAAPSEEEEEMNDVDEMNAFDHDKKSQGFSVGEQNSLHEAVDEAEDYDTTTALPQREDFLSANLDVRQPLLQKERELEEEEEEMLGFEYKPAVPLPFLLNETGTMGYGDLPGRASENSSMRWAGKNGDEWTSLWRELRPKNSVDVSLNKNGREGGNSSEEPWNLVDHAPPGKESAPEEKCEAPSSQTGAVCTAGPADITEKSREENECLINAEDPITALEALEIPPPLPATSFFRLEQKMDNDNAPTIVDEQSNMEEFPLICNKVAEVTPLQANGAHILSVYPLQRPLGDYKRKGAESSDEDQLWQRVYHENLGRKADSRVCQQSPMEKYSRGSAHVSNLNVDAKVLGDI
ncbi:hypothetical protein Tc00.1047053506797.30 [Trypanosoma cruzi]|uniref:Uncharacterized protein n=1 Tax=Trypanosoma cruzi (strain CL Brener) TaxID=353153 RepID=Q4DA12_TRYCC|nr:hypothetical protein Tc00.1047053506797.30 [Trypanosoma cruzi]EAN89357.1 hypothetical protein Tc00.1047053506797.30 [Trypanosoma cruzi]|eukprot:XP_811208.1 hypothetical protein [Trypanosoma cruzi strain CL Brener]